MTTDQLITAHAAALAVWHPLANDTFAKRDTEAAAKSDVMQAIAALAACKAADTQAGREEPSDETTIASSALATAQAIQAIARDEFYAARVVANDARAAVNEPAMALQTRRSELEAIDAIDSLTTEETEELTAIVAALGE